MAIYPYKCPECGRTEEVVQSISSYSEAPTRPWCCKGRMERVICAPMLSPDLATSYVSMIDGTVINSRSQEKEHMAKHGVVKYDDMAGEFEQKRQQREQEFTKSLKSDMVEALKKVEAGYKPQSIPNDKIIPEGQGAMI